VREGIWKGIGTDIIYAREDLWKNKKECRTRVPLLLVCAFMTCMGQI